MKRFKFLLLALLIAELACVALFAYDAYTFHEQGEWQLLSIARAAAADPAVLLLDEITANLDAETEARVLEALRRASVGRTVLSVSHRMYENLGGRTVEIRTQGLE